MFKRMFRVLMIHVVVLCCKVVDQLTADGRHYDGRQVTEILRAIRNVAEHWFQPQTVQEEVALEVRLTHLLFILSVRGKTRIEQSLRVWAGVDGREFGGDTAGAGDSRGGGTACCGDREGVLK